MDLQLLWTIFWLQQNQNISNAFINEVRKITESRKKNKLLGTLHVKPNNEDETKFFYSESMAFRLQ